MTSSVKQTVIKNPTWWKRRSSLERWLIVLTLLIFIAAIILSAILSIFATKYKNGCAETQPLVAPPDGCKREDVCFSKTCVNVASQMLDNMDQTADPCQDFFQFACGNFVKNTVIPESQTGQNVFSTIDDLLQQQIRTTVEEPIKPEEPKVYGEVKKLYKACMNTTRIEELGLGPVKSIISYLGGWPVVEGNQWDESKYEWKQSVYKSVKKGYGGDMFVDFSISSDLKNTTFRRITLDQASLGLSREYLVKGMEEKIVKAYYNYMVDVAVMFGANKSIAEKEMLDVMNFQIALANISIPKEQRRNATLLYNPMTIKEMEQKYPYIPWLEYISSIMPDTLPVDENEVIVVQAPSFFEALEAVLNNSTKRVQSNYVVWNAVASSVSFSNDLLRRRQLVYATVVSGKTERPSRWKECIQVVSSSFSIAIGSIYVRKYFHEDSKQLAMEMVSDIQEEFLKILNKVEWMDEKTRSAAIDKAKSMTRFIGYPDELLDDKKVDDFYRKVDITPDNYLESVINVNLVLADYSFHKLRKPFNKTDWISHSKTAVVNAFYSSIENSIQFPAGILQGVFFGKDKPKVMNYGSIGFVIGHEITHGFDDQGRQFDKDGNLVDWWAMETKDAFEKKAKCIVEQYGNYTVPGLGIKLNGINNQGENIADNGGIKEAYYAYQEWAKRNPPEKMLPGLNFTPQQLFWLSAANVWCSVYRPEHLKIIVQTGYHAPGMYRVIVPMSNSPEFAKDFNCPLGSPMNPVKKCTVW